MRLLLYQECDIKGSRILFDSNGFEISAKKQHLEVFNKDEAKCSKSTKNSHSNLPFNVIEICDDIVYKVLENNVFF